MAISPTCPFSVGIGWVCENHPKHAWGEELAVSAVRVCCASLIERMVWTSRT